MPKSDIWKTWDKKIVKFEKKVRIPNYSLSNVNCITLKKKSDFEKIPKSGGCYWI